MPFSHSADEIRIEKSIRFRRGYVVDNYILPYDSAINKIQCWRLYLSIRNFGDFKTKWKARNKLFNDRDNTTLPPVSISSVYLFLGMRSFIPGLLINRSSYACILPLCRRRQDRMNDMDLYAASVLTFLCLQSLCFVRGAPSLSMKEDLVKTAGVSCNSNSLYGSNPVHFEHS